MSSHPILPREQVDQADTWDLTDIFPSDDAWLEAYQEAKQIPSRAEAFDGTLGRSPQDLLAWLRFEDEVGIAIGRLYLYANCKSDEDTANGFYQDFLGKATTTYVMASSAMAFGVPQIMAIPQETLDAWRSACPELAEYDRKLHVIRRRAEHVLSPEAEKLLAAAGEMSGAPGTVSSILHDADLSFPDATDGEGGAHPLTNGTFVPLLMSEDRELRRSAFETYYATLAGLRNTSAALLDAEFKQRRFHAEARHYAGTLQAALDATEVPCEVYHNLIDAVHANLEPMYRYVRLRRELLGVDELHMYDVYVPVIPACQHEYPFDAAKATVLEALAPLGEDYRGMLLMGFGNRWIDVYENEGKRSGAYSTDTCRPHPYVLLNHKDDLDSVFTLAHEMGHALHSYHSLTHQPPSCAEYVIFVAEVASTCNEVLLMRHLLQKTTDRKERAYLINHFLDGMKGTIYRQTMFAEFERAMGRMAEEGTTLTADVLSAEYLRLNELYFGPDMVSDAQIALEWARIPHFFYNYYVFQYATGYSAAVALADRILTEGAPAVADYKRFLSAGGSTDPISLLKIAGVDMSTPAPVNSALQLFGQLVDELEELMAQG